MRYRRITALAAVLAVSSTMALGQVTNLLSNGNLEPTQELGCTRLADVAPDQTAADLAAASEQCLREEDYDNAMATFVVMQVFGVFDAQRVVDVSAHQAVAVLGQNIAFAMSDDDEVAFQAAVERFGGEGAAAHQATCDHLRQIGPPAYHPDYMIQHGQAAFLFPDDPPLVEPFDAGASWDGVLVNFLRCPAA